jgi:hypothetical protein
MTHNELFFARRIHLVGVISGVKDSLCITIPQNLKTFILIYCHTYLDGVLR